MLRFFFRPTDPTTLGFIRIVAGCLILYTHLAYSYDLQNFFGPTAWYDTAAANRERREVPVYAPPPTWDDVYEPTRMAQLPEAPHRRSVVLKYIKELTSPTGTAAETDAKIAFLIRLNNLDLEEVRNREGEAGNAVQGLGYLSNLSREQVDRAAQLAVLADENVREAKRKSRVPDLPIGPSPNAVQAMAPADREALAREAEAMYQSLPTDPNEQSIVLIHWREMDFGQRTASLNFIRMLMKLNPEERERRLDYLNYWNVDSTVPLRKGSPIFSIFFHLTEPWEIKLAHGCMLFVMLLFTLGLYTRVTSFLTWLSILCYINRSQQTLFGMDTMMNITMIYLMIGNSGAALSLDRVRYRYRAVRHALSTGRGVDASVASYLESPPASVSAGFALRLLQIHFCFIYMASGLSKLKGTTWWNTTAYWDTLVNPEFTMVYYRAYEEMVRKVISARPVYAVMAAFGIAFTFITEIGFPMLVWTRLRPYFVMLGLMLHFGIGALMGLVVFSLFMMAMLLGYIPGRVIRERLFGRTIPAERTKLLYDPDRIEHRYAVAWLVAANDSGTLEPLAQAKLAQLTVEKLGKKMIGTEAYRASLGEATLWHPYRLLAYLPVIGGSLRKAFGG